MLIRRALQFFILLPVTLFLLNAVVWHALWSNPDTSSRITDKAETFAVAIGWLVAYCLFTCWALPRTRDVRGVSDARRVLYLSPLVAAPLMCASRALAALVVGWPVVPSDVVRDVTMWLVIGYLHAVFAGAFVVPIAYLSERRKRVLRDAS